VTFSSCDGIGLDYCLWPRSCLSTTSLWTADSDSDFSMGTTYFH